MMMGMILMTNSNENNIIEKNDIDKTNKEKI